MRHSPTSSSSSATASGYACLVPLSTYDKLGSTTGEVKLLTHLNVTEREHTLYGFATKEERDLFRLLIDRVSGIGPKMALSVLSGMSVSDFKDNVIRGDIAALSRISGVGKKTAERIVLELKDKVGIVDTWQAAKGAAARSRPIRPRPRKPMRSWRSSLSVTNRSRRRRRSRTS